MTTWIQPAPQTQVYRLIWFCSPAPICAFYNEDFIMWYSGRTECTHQKTDTGDFASSIRNAHKNKNDLLVRTCFLWALLLPLSLSLCTPVPAACGHVCVCAHLLLAQCIPHSSALSPHTETCVVPPFAWSLSITLQYKPWRSAVESEPMLDTATCRLIHIRWGEFTFCSQCYSQLAQASVNSVQHRHWSHSLLHLNGRLHTVLLKRLNSEGWYWQK